MLDRLPSYLLVIVIELVLDDGATVPLVVVDELLDLYSVLRDDLLGNIIDESMGTDCDLLLLYLLEPYFTSSNKVRAILPMNL